MLVSAFLDAEDATESAELYDIVLSKQNLTTGLCEDEEMLWYTQFSICAEITWSRLLSEEA